MDLVDAIIATVVFHLVHERLELTIPPTMEQEFDVVSDGDEERMLARQSCVEVAHAGAERIVTHD